MLQGAAQPVQLVDVHRIARAQLGQQLVDFDAGDQRAGGFFLVNELAPGLREGIELELQVLVASVANLRKAKIGYARPQTAFRKL